MPSSVACVMDTAAGHVESVRGEVDALLRRVTGSVEDLASAWLGGAGGAFQKVMVDWNDQSRKLNEALGGIAELGPRLERGYRVRVRLPLRSPGAAP